MRYLFFLVLLALTISVLIAPETHLFATAIHLPSPETATATLDQAVRHLMNMDLQSLPR
jgi:hypothetical protein